MSYAYNGSVRKYPLGSPIYSDHALRIAKNNTRDFTKMGELDQPVIFYYRCGDGDMLELSIKYYTQNIVILSHTHDGSTYGTICDGRHALYGPNGEVWDDSDHRYESSEDRANAFFQFMEQFNEKQVTLQDDDEDFVV